MEFLPSYVELFQSGRLAESADLLEGITRSCTLCPHRCRVDRRVSKGGRCGSGLLPMVSSYSPHFGEEPPLVGTKGSGTIFFTHCNMRCIFCQNYEISQLGEGTEVSYEDLALMMMRLQGLGCHNINLVTPTHMLYAVVRALTFAIPKGLRVPLVYNSGGYDSADILRLLTGVFDIYMPDFKYADDEKGEMLSGVKQYAREARAAVREMHAQVGDLSINGRGVAVKGLLVRHLVLPDDLAGSLHVVDFLAGLSKGLVVNIMDQYRPAYRAREHPGLGRRATLEEVDDVVRYARSRGMGRIIR